MSNSNQNALVPANMGKVASVFASVQGQNYVDDVSAGVSAGFGVVSIRGKEFSIRYRGEEQSVLDTNGEAVRSIPVVILKGSQAIGKIFYEKAYAPGDDASPDCYSIQGIKPEADSPKRQSEACAGCRWNVFGSRVTDNGKKAKACSDSRRVAVVPLADIDNEVYGGPMLLRVPPASLAEMAGFFQKMQALGYPYFAIATRLGFTNDAFPKLAFSAIRVLDDAEGAKVMALRDDPRVDYILHQSREGSDQQAPPSQVEQVQAAFEQPPEPKPAAPAPKPPAQTTPPAQQVAKAGPRTGTQLGGATPAAPAPSVTPAEPIQTPAAAPKVEAVAEGDPLGDILDGLLPN